MEIRAISVYENILSIDFVRKIMYHNFYMKEYQLKTFDSSKFSVRKIQTYFQVAVFNKQPTAFQCEVYVSTLYAYSVHSSVKFIWISES